MGGIIFWEAAISGAILPAACSQASDGLKKHAPKATTTPRPQGARECWPYAHYGLKNMLPKATTILRPQGA